jgi:hypothetical protein
MRTIAALQARILETGYDDQVTMRLEVRRGNAQKLAADLIEATHGQLAIDPPLQL